MFKNKYAFRILLDGIDITDKVKTFSISCDLENYCRELTMDFYDPSFYDTLDFYKIPEDARIEVFTSVIEVGA